MSFLPIQEIHAFVTSQRSAHTGRAYRQDIDAFLKWMGDDEITEQNVIQWRDYIENELSNASALRRFTTLRTFYKFMGGPNPFERVKPPRRISSWTPVVPSEQDVDALFNVCRTPTDYVILSLLSNGLRAQEVCDLGPSDFYFEPAHNAHILRVLGKGMKQRLIPATDETVEALKYLSLPIRGLNIRKVYHRIKVLSKLAGVNWIHPHALRHSYATRLIRNGVDVFSLQRLLGHSRAETTGVYVTLDLSDLVRASLADPRRMVRNVTETQLLQEIN